MENIQQFSGLYIFYGYVHIFEPSLQVEDE
jgi:hypothetical protein